MRKAYEKTISRLIDAMEAGIIPWRRPWITPCNAISGKAYRGINFLLLSTADFADPRYITFLQAKEMGGHVKAGANGYPIIKWIYPSKEDVQKNPNLKPYAKVYTVFNVSQCELVKLPELISVEHNPLAEAQAIIDNWNDKPSIEYGGFKAGYSPRLDKVLMPEMAKFHSPEAYYDTYFHELIHSTGNESRLNRENAPRFMADKYGFEELVAEIGGAMLCSEAGIDNANLIENNAAYLRGWLNAVNNDPEMLVKAASMAAKAADMIMGRCFAVEDESEEQQPDEILVAAA